MAELSVNQLLALRPDEFERLVGHVFQVLGYEVEVVGRPGDQGVDLRLEKSGEGSIAQCKRLSGAVAQSQIRDFFGTVQHEKAVRGYFVTTGTFSLAASTWARDKPLILVDGSDLLQALENLQQEKLVKLLAHTESQDQTAERVGILETVRSALDGPSVLGRILIDGPPPLGRNYKEVAEYLRRELDLATPVCEYEGISIRGRNWNRSLFISNRGTVVFVDEFDCISPAIRRSLLEHQNQGKNLYAYFSSDPWEVDWVLVCTRWERRLQKAEIARFSTVLPSGSLEWEDIPTLEEWAQRDKEVVRKEKKVARQKAAAQRKRLSALSGLYCTECRAWFATRKSSGACEKCKRSLRFDELRGSYTTKLAGFFGSSWRTADVAAVQGTKDRYIEEKLGGDSPTVD